MEHFGTLGTLWNVWNTFAQIGTTENEIQLILYHMIVQIPIHLTLPNKLYLSAKMDIEPFVVTSKNVFGMFVYGLLEKKSSLRKDIDLSDKYTEVVKLQISEKIFNTRGIHWTNQANHLFNLFVAELMKDDFHEYMDYHFLLNKVQLRQAIWDWQQRNNLYEDAIGLRTLEKDYERYRKRKYDRMGESSWMKIA